MTALVAYNRVLTDSEQRHVWAYLSNRYGFAAGNVACLGDSITQGSATRGVYPTRLAELLGSTWRVTNYGVSGAFVNQSVAADNMYNDQWLNGTTGAKRRRYNWIVCLGGVNNIRNFTPTGSTQSDHDNDAATIFALYDDLLNEIIAEPLARLVLCTVMPFKGDSAWSADQQGILLAFNTLIRNYAAAHSANTYLVDLYAIMGSPVDSAALATPYNLDNLHPIKAGADAIAEAIAEKHPGGRARLVGRAVRSLCDGLATVASTGGAVRRAFVSKHPTCETDRILV
jgi:lysophospholipase L1-like esterase